MENYNNRKILITNIWLENFAGSELNCWSLAKELKRRGAIVTVATFKCGMPMMKLFDNSGIDVVNVLTDELNDGAYDLIWAHHYPVLDYLLFNKGVIAKKIIWSCLGPEEPLEAPPAYANELSLILGVSEYALERNIRKGGINKSVKIFPNYISAEWLQSSKMDFADKPKSISIVSNHTPKELEKAASILSKQGIQVNIYGLGHKVVNITPELIARNDVIITIGKTVIYSMSQKVPVYCYDIHGGPGYISKDNYQQGEYNNFSGRGCEKKNAEQIASEILIGFECTLRDVEWLREKIIKTRQLEKNIDVVLDEIESADNVDCSLILKNYPWVAKHNETAIRWFRQVENTLNNPIWQIRKRIKRVLF